MFEVKLPHDLFKVILLCGLFTAELLARLHNAKQSERFAFSGIAFFRKSHLRKKVCTMNLLEVKNICKTYGSGETAVHALKNVSFSVPKGEYVAVVGESGSGKSTLMNIMGILDRQTSGNYFLEGEDVNSMDDTVRSVMRNKKIGFVFQNFNLFPHYSVMKNITDAPLKVQKR